MSGMSKTKEYPKRLCQRNAFTIKPVLSVALLFGLSSCFAFVPPIEAAAVLTVTADIDNHLYQQQQQYYSSYNNPTMSQVQRKMFKRPTIAEYEAQRAAVVATERGSNFESDTPELTEREQLVNEIVMAAKQEELKNGHANPHTFAPSQHFFEVMDQIRESTIYKIIRKMPKGGILHAHDTAIASVDFLVSVTYREHLWQGIDTKTSKIVDFKFSLESPAQLKSHLNWTLVATERSKQGREQYDAHVRSLFTLRTDNPRHAYRDINAVWEKFMSIFMLVEPLLTFVPVWKDYYRQSLLESFEDNVQYLEFRGLLPKLYDLVGRTYNESDSVQMYVDVLKQFKLENPEFIGSKFIFAPLKAVPEPVFEEYFRTVVKLHEQFPDFVAGFDLVGQEDTARNLTSVAEMVLQLPEDLKFCFHAGETNWFGSVDENLVIFTEIQMKI